MKKEKLDKIKKFLINNINIFIYVIISVILIVLICLQFIDKNVDSERISAIKDISKSSKIKYVLNDKAYYLGESAKKLFDDGFTIEGNNINNKIKPDSFVVKTFYYDNVPYFQAALYCAQKEECSYDDAITIKINFYQKSRVVIDDEISFSSTNKKVEELLGEPSGAFYLDNKLKVWSNSNKVGKPYYVIGFNYNSVKDLRSGIWWYEEEKRNTVVKEYTNE